MNGTAEFTDIQGIVRFGHRRLTAARFFLLQIADPAAARQWLAAAPVTDATERTPRPDSALQVALTVEGLRALGTPAPIVAGFSAEFIAGMAGDGNRSHRLGDTGANDPAHWRWGYADAVPHLLVMLYALPDRLDAWQSEITGGVWEQAFAVIDCLATTDLDGREPFGFVDGISQPTIDWQRSGNFDSPQLEYRNLSALGEFLLGYPNEYGKYTDRPLIDPATTGATLLPAAEDMPAQRDLGRNGTYLVLRDLSQDVSGFWRFLDQQSATGHSAPDLAAAMVGRTIDGAPLVPLSRTPLAGAADDSQAPANNQTPANTSQQLHLRR